MSALAATAPLASVRRIVGADPWIGVFAIVTVVPAAAAGGGAGLALGILAFALAGVIARLVAAPSDQRFLLRLGLGSIALHSVAAGVLDIYLRGQSSSGSMFYDDAAYVGFAKMLAQYWEGRIETLPSDPSVSNIYVIVVGLLFSTFGPIVMLPRLLNALFLTIAALLLYRTMQNLEMPGAKVASAVLLAFPSVALWSLLVLKDIYVLTFAVTAVWSVSEFIRSRHYAWWIPTLIAFLAIDSARRYVFLVLVLAWPLGMLLGAPKRQRLRAAGLATVFALMLFGALRPFDQYNMASFASLAQIRQNMAFGARTAFVEPASVVRFGAGTEFVVEVAGRTSVPDARTIVVEPGARLFVEEAVPASSPDPARTLVRPGDRVIVRAPGVEATTSPGSSAPTVDLRTDMANVVSNPVARPADDTLQLQRGIADSVGHLPTGVLHLVAAPFPFAARSLYEVATIPEMLLWYISLALAAVGAAALVRARDFRFAYGVIILAGLALVLSLVEGNVGTLLRHRAMLIPFVLVLAAVGLDRVLARRATRSTA